ncbi:hypothetical protein PT2222_50395 [Paraburkholderia tropica]
MSGGEMSGEISAARFLRLFRAQDVNRQREARGLRAAVLSSGRVTGRARLVVDAHAHLDRHLPVRNLVVFDQAARFHDLEPVQMTQRFRRARDGAADGVVAGHLGRSGEFDLLVDMVAHDSVSVGHGCSGMRQSSIDTVACGCALRRPGRRL